MFMSSNGDKFAFICVRPVEPDGLLGRLRLTVNNPLWNTQYSVTDLQITSYPDPAPVTTTTSVDADGNTVVNKQVGDGVNLSSVIMKATMYLGSMSLFVKGLPYGGCLIVITGTVKMNPPTPGPGPGPTPAPGPTPPDGVSPVVMQTIMQMPVNYGEPNKTTYVVGTVIMIRKPKH